MRDRDERQAAGGIRSVAEAGRYLALADEILDPDWTTPAHFRIGASALYTVIRSVLNQQVE